MPRNGAGTFSLVAGNPVVSNTTISSSWANSTLSDISAALTQSIAKDGQTVATANLPMGGFKHTNVADAAQANEYATLSQVQASTSAYLVGVSGGDTITASGAPPVTAYTAGNNYRFKAVSTNTTTNVTINIDGVGAIPLKRNDGNPVGIGGIVSGEVVEFTYDGANGIITSTSMSLADGGTAGASRASGLNNLLPTQAGMDGYVLTTNTLTYTTTTRARASNVATLVITPTATMPSTGDQVVITGTLPAAYMGTKVITAVGVNSISYFSAGSDESTTADVGGIINNYVPTFQEIPSYPRVRQTVSSGPIDASGLPNFGGSTGSTTVTATGTLTVTSANGSTDTTIDITNPSWTGLSVNGTRYLWIDTSAGSTGSTNLIPVYQFGGTSSSTNDVYTFNIQQMIMRAGNGSSAPQVNRVFVGEVVVAGGVVTTITWYAIMGRYVSSLTALPALGGVQTFTHNIGVPPQFISWSLTGQCTSAVSGYVVGDTIDDITTVGAGGTNSRTVKQKKTKYTASISGDNTGGYIVTQSAGGPAVAISGANFSTYQTLNRTW